MDIQQKVDLTIEQWRRLRIEPYLKALELENQNKNMEAMDSLNEISLFDFLKDFDVAVSKKTDELEKRVAQRMREIFNKNSITKENFMQAHDRITFASFFESIRAARKSDDAYDKDFFIDRAGTSLALVFCEESQSKAKAFSAAARGILNATKCSKFLEAKHRFPSL
ncbi:MAG: hypothetical protein COB76_00485 [Alphaproteobacteria bacterium]|nr:MAG: hypothetical protein COB76_00485 [Alphaproteobacteria bacterium]